MLQELSEHSGIGVTCTNGSSDFVNGGPAWPCFVVGIPRWHRWSEEGLLLNMKHEPQQEAEVSWDII